MPLSRSVSLCSNSLIFSSPVSSLSVSVLPPDLSVSSGTRQPKVCRSIDLDLLDQLPESRVDLSPDTTEDLPPPPCDLTIDTSDLSRSASPPVPGDIKQSYLSYILYPTDASSHSTDN